MKNIKNCSGPTVVRYQLRSVAKCTILSEAVLTHLHLLSLFICDIYHVEQVNESVVVETIFPVFSWHYYYSNQSKIRIFITISEQMDQ